MVVVGGGGLGRVEEKQLLRDHKASVIHNLASRWQSVSVSLQLYPTA